MDFQPVFQANRVATQRMQQIVRRLSEKDLSQSRGNDWTIAVTLAHLAFWDQRVIHVIQSARKNHGLQVPYFDDQLNDILAPVFSIILPTEAAAFAIRTAGALDCLLEETSPDLLEEMIKLNNRLVERSLHRNGHLDDIEAFME
jgi:hypothetical protein